MKFRDLLIEKRAAVLEKWFQLILKTYPAGGAGYLERKDRFQNPVGFIISEGIGVLYDELLKDESLEAIQDIQDNPANSTPALDDIVKIRSVQDFSPSRAVVFVFMLKRAIDETLGAVIGEKKLYAEVREFEAKIDRLALRAFDSYMESREKLFEIRIKEAKSGAFKLIERLNRGPDKTAAE